MTSPEIFKKRDFLWDKNIIEWKIRSLGPGLLCKQTLAIGGGLKPKVNVFKMCYILLWRRGEEAIVTPTYHRRRSGGGVPNRLRLWAIFWKE